MCERERKKRRASFQPNPPSREGKKKKKKKTGRVLPPTTFSQQCSTPPNQAIQLSQLFFDNREMDKRKIPQGSPTPDGEDRARKRRKQTVSLLLAFLWRWGCRWFGGVSWRDGEGKSDIEGSKLCLNVLACGCGIPDEAQAILLLLLHTS